MNRLDETLQRVYDFHGHKSPGTTIGVFMVDYAIELMDDVTGDNEGLNAFVETIPCLPDAIQLITGCTLGNERMHVVNYGKFALTLYNKETGKGIRVRLDQDKTVKYSNLHDWFLKKKPKKDLPKDLVIKDMMDARRDVLSYERVRVKIKKKKFPARICIRCNEAFSSDDGDVCKGCADGSYYETY